MKKQMEKVSHESFICVRFELKININKNKVRENRRIRTSCKFAGEKKGNRVIKCETERI